MCTSIDPHNEFCYTIVSFAASWSWPTRVSSLHNFTATDAEINDNFPMVDWCSGYHVCFTLLQLWDKVSAQGRRFDPGIDHCYSFALINLQIWTFFILFKACPPSSYHPFIS